MKTEALSAHERLQIVLLLAQAQYGYPTRVEDISLDNPATWQLFRQGTTEHLLHFRATGMKAYLQDLHPKKTCRFGNASFVIPQSETMPPDTGIYSKKKNRFAISSG